MTDRLIATYFQGEDEERVYSFDASEFGSTPTAVSYKVYDISSGRTDDDDTDVTDDTMTGDATVVLDTITLPALTGLTANHVYRIEVQFTSGDNVFEPWIKVLAEY